MLNRYLQSISSRLVGLALLLGLLLGAASAAQAQDSPLDGIVPSLTGEDPDAKPSDQPAIELLPTPDAEALGEHLEQDSLWKTFFDREPIGFGLGTFTALEDDAAALWERLRAGWWAWLDDPLGPPLRGAVPVALLLAGLALHLAIDRRARRLGPAARTKLKERAPEWAQRLGAALADGGALVLAPLALLALGRLAAALLGAEESLWAQATEQALLVFLVYRVAEGGLKATLGGTLLSIDPEQVRSLHAFVLGALRVIVAFQVTLVVVEALGYRAEAGHDVSRVLVFLNKVTIAVVALRLIGLRAQVMEFFPAGQPGTFAAKLREVIGRYYRGVVGVSILLTLLWAVGFDNAATYVLVRGYGIMAALALVAAVQRRLETLFRRRRGQTLNVERRESLRRLERASALALWGVTVAVVLHLLGLQDLVLHLLQIPLVRVGSAPLSLYSVGKAVVIFAAFLLGSRLLRLALNERIYPRFGIEVGVGYAINTVAHYALFVLGALAALIALGVKLGALTVFAGALGVGIGFGLQDITRNLVSGFILLFGRSVKKGDVVRVDDYVGVVEGLGARSVHLVTPDNREVVIPSSRLVESSIVNFTYSNPTVRVQIPVGVHYNSDVRLVEQALLNAAWRHGEVLHDPPPRVWLKGFGDNSVDFILLVWIDVRRVPIEQLTGELNFHIWDVLKEQGVEIPYPQRDLHLREGPMLAELIRAIRGEPPTAAEEAQAPPPLRPRHSYLYDYDHSLKMPHIDVREELTERLRDERDTRRRSRDFQELMERYVTGREASLARLAAQVAAHVQAQRKDTEHNPLDDLLDEALNDHGAPIRRE